MALREDPFAGDELAPASAIELPQYALPTQSRNTYVYDYRALPRVTSILSLTGGDRLVDWAAEESALHAAAIAVVSGLADDPKDPRLSAYIETRLLRHPTADEAIDLLVNWRYVGLAPANYKDHKGRVGTICHTVKHEFSLEREMPKTKDAMIDYCCAIADQRNLIPERLVMFYEEQGKTKTDALTHLAFESLPYVDETLKYFRVLQSEPVAIGFEATVVNLSIGYGGTADELGSKVKRRNWEATGHRWPSAAIELGLDELIFCGDIKTSNYLRKKAVAMQMAAYIHGEKVVLWHDQTEAEVPYCNAMVAWHVVPGEGVLPYAWVGDAVIEDCFDTFCALAYAYQGMNNMPKASRRLDYKDPRPVPPKRGERPCPI